MASPLLMRPGKVSCQLLISLERQPEKKAAAQGEGERREEKKEREGGRRGRGRGREGEGVTKPPNLEIARVPSPQTCLPRAPHLGSSRCGQRQHLQDRETPVCSTVGVHLGPSPPCTCHHACVTQYYLTPTLASAQPPTAFCTLHRHCHAKGHTGPNQAVVTHGTGA